MNSWHAEVLEVIADNPHPHEQRRVIAVCSICHTPVLGGQDPVPVYGQVEDDKPIGWIHGAFDCMDAPRCEETTGGMVPGTGEWDARCLLPSSHNLDCYFGSP